MIVLSHYFVAFIIDKCLRFSTSQQRKQWMKVNTALYTQVRSEMWPFSHSRMSHLTLHWKTARLRRLLFTSVSHKRGRNYEKFAVEYDLLIRLSVIHHFSAIQPLNFIVIVVSEMQQLTKHSHFSIQSHKLQFNRIFLLLKVSQSPLNAWNYDARERNY